MAQGQLAEYRRKRDFKKTAEPSGDAAVAPAPHARFVIQKHDATRLHYDFRLEVDGVLKSWAVTKGPSLDPADKRLSVEVEDHPLDYGDFEGTIPQGQYGGGTVQLWDRGYWSPEPGFEDVAKALKKGELKFVLEGDRLHGSWVLVRMNWDRNAKDGPKRQEGGKRSNWLLIKHNDEAARPGEGTAVLDEDASIASGRTMADIAAGKGKGPKPFILKAKGKGDAVWSSRTRAEREALQREAEETRTFAPAVSSRPKRSADPGPTPERRASGGPGSSRSALVRDDSRKGKGKPAVLPDFIEPQLCKSLDRPPAGPGWAHEIKFDGYRMQLRVEGGIFRTKIWNADEAPTPFRAIAGGFTAVEAEFVIRLGKDAPAGKTEWTAEEAADYVGELMVGIEIAGSPLAAINALGPPIVASDFGNNDGQILGPVVENWRDIAWEDMPAETFINGVSVGKGGAASIPGSPLAALAFLLGHVAARGRPLKKGMLVTTGASTGIHDIAAGETARVDFGPLGSVACVAVPALGENALRET